MGRFLLIGLDGAEPSLLGPWMDAGRLPNLARLRETGAYVPCASTTPPATFPAWTTCVTGVNPGKHGVFDFTRMRGGAYALEFVNSTQREAPALWNILSAAGRRVAVLGVPATYPPENVNGLMVSGFDSPVCTRVDRSFVSPPDCYADVKEWRFADFQETDTGPGWHALALRRLLEGIAIKETIALRLYQREPWDFFMVVFGESDTVAHHFWMFHDSESPRHQAGFEEAIAQVYERLDQAVGRLLDAAGGDVTAGIVSDHGFGGAGTGVVHLNNWLAQEGHLRFSGAGESWLKRAALTLVPGAWRGALFRRLRGMASRAESFSRFGGIDWAHTTAWSEELNYFPSVRVNLRGREPRGQVEPREYQDFCSHLCAKLRAWEPIANAWHRDEIFDGPFVERAPDIILELALEDGYSHSCLRARGGPAFRRIGPGEYLGGKERGMNGNHRPTGILLLSKPTPVGYARLEDVAPTVLAEMGLPAPPMDGVSLLEPGETTDGAPAATSHTDQPYTPGEAEAVERRLRDLGYFE